MQPIRVAQMMENAGRSLARLARHLLGGSAVGRKVAVMVGKGNNGGGGLVAARHLANAGADIHVMLAAAPDELGTVPERQRLILARMGVTGSHRPTAVIELPELLEEAELVLDALVGYSLRGNPREPVARFIRAANAAAAQRVALDISSGLGGDSGRPLEPWPSAAMTCMTRWRSFGHASIGQQRTSTKTWEHDRGIEYGECYVELNGTDIIGGTGIYDDSWENVADIG